MSGFSRRREIPTSKPAHPGELVAGLKSLFLSLGRGMGCLPSRQLVADILYEDDGPRAVKCVFAVTLLVYLASGSHGPFFAALNGYASSWRTSSMGQLVDTTRRWDRPTLRRADLRVLVGSGSLFLSLCVLLAVRPFTCGACAFVDSNQRVGRSLVGWCTCLWKGSAQVRWK